MSWVIIGQYAYCFEIVHHRMIGSPRGGNNFLAGTSPSALLWLGSGPRSQGTVVRIWLMAISGSSSILRPPCLRGLPSSELFHPPSTHTPIWSHTDRTQPAQDQLTWHCWANVADCVGPAHLVCWTGQHWAEADSILQPNGGLGWHFPSVPLNYNSCSIWFLLMSIKLVIAKHGEMKEGMSAQLCIIGLLQALSFLSRSSTNPCCLCQLQCHWLDTHVSVGTGHC